jgi:hypothetical protein
MVEKTTSGKERLKELADKKLKQSQTNPIDWEKHKETWLEQVRLFYQNINDWLKDIPSIKIENQGTWITEEYIGRYQVDRQLIYLGDTLISLTPRGTLIIGARGRIDINSSNNKQAMLILEKKGERPTVIFTNASEPPPPKPEPETKDYEWLIVRERKAKDFTVLNEETLADLIADFAE